MLLAAFSILKAQAQSYSNDFENQYTWYPPWLNLDIVSAIASTPLVCFLWKSQAGELLRKGTLKTISLTEMSETPAVRRNYNLYPGNVPGGKDAFAGLMEFARGWAKKKLLV